MVREQRTVAEMEKAPSQKVEARVLPDGLVFRFRIAGRDAFALAKWAPVAGPQTAELVLKPQIGPWLLAWKKGKPVRVEGEETWRKLTAGMIEQLAPADRRQGVLLLAQDHEVVAFRDAAGRAAVVPLEKRPRTVRVVRTVGEAELGRMVMARLAAGGGAARTLFVTGRRPPWVYVEPGTDRVIFLRPPAGKNGEAVAALLGTETPRLAWGSARALAWNSSLASVINNPVSFCVRLVEQVTSISETFLHTRLHFLQQPKGSPVAAGPPMDLAAWEKELDHLVGATRQPAKLDLLVDGAAFFPEFIQAVQDARQSVDVQTYIFDNDDYAVKIADLLKERSRQVKVRVMMDELGSLFAGAQPPDSPMPAGFVCPPDMGAYLEDGSRVAVRPLANPWLWASHKKLTVIDGRTAFLGGMNIGREYRYDWHDLMVKLEGPLVGELQRDFSESWAVNGPGGDAAWLWRKLFPPQDRAAGKEQPGMIQVRPLYTRTFEHEIEKAQVAAIRRCRREIIIENPYFTDDLIVTELIAARERGVDVRVIVPEVNDQPLMATSNRVSVGEMLQHGIRVYAYPRMSHAKAALYDGWACLGSANLDRLSLRLNHELNIAFSDPAAVARLRRDFFEKDLAASKEVTAVPDLPWAWPFIEMLGNQM